MILSRSPRAALSTLLTGALLLSACGGEEGSTPAADAAKGAGGPLPAASGAPAGGGQGGGGGGSAVLSGTDIHTVTAGAIEAGIPVSGTLRPIETVSVRARIEGDLVALNVREGDAVSTGTVLAEFERTEQEAALRSAEADSIAARTEAQTAQWNLEQTKELYTAGAVPERDFRAAEQAALAATARLAGAAARVRAASAIARDTRVLSPVNGIVERRAVENGERVTRGTVLFTVVRSDRLELAAAVPARRAASLRAGQIVRFTADGRTSEGRVARVSPTIDPQSQSVTVFVEVPNAGGALKGNTFATGRIVERALTGQIVIPQAALRQTAPTAAAASQPFVWRLAGGVLERADVSLGIVDEARGVVQVLSGLAAGDQIVVGNVGLLGAGMQVQVIGTDAARPPR